ncbi:hypothetical protein [Haloechinothrix sp. LS1_15]|uniref:hypothetical protein n=1 Tax=Haloechinothrix sp. LS1_15 TaxID=2652248 RepID=UPI00294594F6|nr:hypothetical protein [Haloechinothrix sp. LS1_15]MDV6011187.1 hypothetical protein [Haloechinothrix sp. LS1_15]
MNQPTPGYGQPAQHGILPTPAAAQPEAQPAGQQAMAGPPVAPQQQESVPPWMQRARARTPLHTLIGVELRKLAGTISDRILLITGPLVLVGLGTVGVFLGPVGYYTAESQIGPTVWLITFSAIVIHAAVIKLVAGEWQHRSAQPTLLQQPSRARYFLAQACVVLLVWLVAAALQVGTTLVATPIAVDQAGSGYLLGYRLGWVIGVIALGSLLTILTALIVAMLIPNAAGALALYCAVVPALLILTGSLPEYFVWIAPAAAAFELAGTSPVDHAGPVITSLTLWATLLVLAIWRVSRRDLA